MNEANVMEALEQNSILSAAIVSRCPSAGTLFALLHFFEEELNLKVYLIDMFVIEALSFTVVAVTVIIILSLRTGGIRITLKQLICQV